jgi:hypothetical protein
MYRANLSLAHIGGTHLYTTPKTAQIEPSDFLRNGSL